MSASVAERLQYLFGQQKDCGSNPGSAICLEQLCYNINLLGGHGTVWPVCVESAVEHQPTIDVNAMLCS